MDAAGLSPKAGRSPQDIAERMIAKAAESHSTLTLDQADTLRSFLALESPLDEAVGKLREFAVSAGLDLGPALEDFDRRTELLAGRDVDPAMFHYRASFGRKLEYYTGMLFEVHEKGAEEAVAGGGRYDHLCTLLGADAAVSAVGFSITLDRLGRGGS